MKGEWNCYYSNPHSNIKMPHTLILQALRKQPPSPPRISGLASQVSALMA